MDSLHGESRYVEDPGAMMAEHPNMYKWVHAAVLVYSCYRCLRSYQNKFEHYLLDRHLGSDLLQFLLFNSLPTAIENRIIASTDLLFEDLARQDYPGIVIGRTTKLSIKELGDCVVPIAVYIRTARHLPSGCITL